MEEIETEKKLEKERMEIEKRLREEESKRKLKIEN